MHQAIEAKEGVEIKAENQTLATITLQNYFRLYDKLSGMTGTAQTEAAEFHKIYKVGVVSIPTNRPMIRADQADLIYKTEKAKFNAVVDGHRRAAREGPAGAGRHHQRGEVRSTCRSCSSSGSAARGAQRQVPRAGGRDHRGGRAAAARSPSPPTWPAAAPTSCSAATPSSSPTSSCAARPRPGRDPEEYEAAWDDVVDESRKRSRPRPRRSIDAGGLYVLGTERHESRRIDNQLRGRSGRQGDPGESRFYLSLGDELMRRFNGRRRVEGVMDRLNIPDDVPIEAKMVTKANQERADPGRAAELRDPQERPQVRRGAQQAAHGHLRRAPPRARRRGHQASRSSTCSTTSSTPTSTAPPPRATPRTGTSTSSGRR